MNPFSAWFNAAQQFQTGTFFTTQIRPRFPQKSLTRPIPAPTNDLPQATLTKTT
jgi:hypothetical protein